MKALPQQQEIGSTASPIRRHVNSQVVSSRALNRILLFFSILTGLAFVHVYQAAAVPPEQNTSEQDQSEQFRFAFKYDGVLMTEVARTLSEHTAENYVSTLPADVTLDAALDITSDSAPTVNDIFSRQTEYAVVPISGVNFIVRDGMESSVAVFRSKNYRRRPVSLDLDHTPLQSVIDVLQLAWDRPIERKALKTQTITQTITLKLTDIPADYALAIIGHLLALDIEEKKGVITIRERSDSVGKVPPTKRSQSSNPKPAKSPSSSERIAR